jgi:hypothetical protein
VLLEEARAHLAGETSLTEIRFVLFGEPSYRIFEKRQGRDRGPRAARPDAAAAEPAAAYLLLREGPWSSRFSTSRQGLYLLASLARARASRSRDP